MSTSTFIEANSPQVPHGTDPALLNCGFDLNDAGNIAFDGASSIGQAPRASSTDNVNLASIYNRDNLLSLPNPTPLSMDEVETASSSPISVGMRPNRLSASGPPDVDMSALEGDASDAPPPFNLPDYMASPSVHSAMLSSSHHRPPSPNQRSVDDRLLRQGGPSTGTPRSANDSAILRRLLHLPQPWVTSLSSFRVGSSSVGETQTMSAGPMSASLPRGVTHSIASDRLRSVLAQHEPAISHDAPTRISRTAPNHLVLTVADFMSSSEDSDMDVEFSELARIRHETQRLRRRVEAAELRTRMMEADSRRDSARRQIEFDAEIDMIRRLRTAEQHLVRSPLPSEPSNGRARSRMSSTLNLGTQGVPAGPSSPSSIPRVSAFGDAQRSSTVYQPPARPVDEPTGSYVTQPPTTSLGVSSPGTGRVSDMFTGPFQATFRAMELQRQVDWDPPQSPTTSLQYSQRTYVSHGHTDHRSATQPWSSSNGHSDIGAPSGSRPTRPLPLNPPSLRYQQLVAVAEESSRIARLEAEVEHLRRQNASTLAALSSDTTRHARNAPPPLPGAFRPSGHHHLRRSSDIMMEGSSGWSTVPPRPTTAVATDHDQLRPVHRLNPFDNWPEGLRHDRRAVALDPAPAAAGTSDERRREHRSLNSAAWERRVEDMRRRYHSRSHVSPDTTVAGAAGTSSASDRRRQSAETHMAPSDMRRRVDNMLSDADANRVGGTAVFGGSRRGYRSPHISRWIPTRFNRGDFLLDDDFDASYEALLALSDGLGEARVQRTPQDVLDKFDNGAYGDWAGPDSDKRCPICLDDYGITDRVLKLSNCQHWMHKDCLQQWLNGSTTCPVCRKNVLPTTGNTSQTSVNPRSPRGRPSRPPWQRTRVLVRDSELPLHSHSAYRPSVLASGSRARAPRRGASDSDDEEDEVDVILSYMRQPRPPGSSGGANGSRNPYL